MEDLNNILNDILGVVDNSTAPSSVNSTESSSSQFSETDISEILSDNGIPSTNPVSVEDTSSTIESEDNDEERSEREAAENEDISTEEESTETVDSEESLPLNSPTLLIQDATARFSGMKWFDKVKEMNIILAGLGGIGSNTAYQLARMSPNKLVLYDDDTVDIVNMSGQLYSSQDVGKFKVNAMEQMLQLYTVTNKIYALPKRFTTAEVPGDIMICGFDNMEAREIFYQSWRMHVENCTEKDKHNCLFIDGRLSVDTLQVLCIAGTDSYCMDRYEKEFLFSDAEADATVCSMKQTTYLACMIGSIIVNLFINFVANLLNPVIPYSLPFFTEYNAQLMMFKTED